MTYLSERAAELHSAEAVFKHVDMKNSKAAEILRPFCQVQLGSAF